MLVGIAGVGVVGGAVDFGFKMRGIKVICYDKFRDGMQNFEDLLRADAIFVCVPTLTHDITWTQDLSPLQDVLGMLAAAQYRGVVCVKSTVLPGTMRKMKLTYADLRLVHNPEFLTAAAASDDFLQQEKIFISAPVYDDGQVISRIYDAFDPSVPQFIVHDWEVTEIIKYWHNCFCAVKVSFSREMLKLAQFHEMDFELIRLGAGSLRNIGMNHTKQPGPDGKEGWGGMCFPKDMKALRSYMGEKGLTSYVIGAAIDDNTLVRPEEMK